MLRGRNFLHLAQLSSANSFSHGDIYNSSMSGGNATTNSSNNSMLMSREQDGPVYQFEVAVRFSNADSSVSRVVPGKMFALC